LAHSPPDSPSCVACVAMGTLQFLFAFVHTDTDAKLIKKNSE
jgi:hypothetical protein